MEKKTQSIYLVLCMVDHFHFPFRFIYVKFLFISFPKNSLQDANV